MCYFSSVVNVRFSSALQIMMSLAHAQDLGFSVLSSSQLAEGLNTTAPAVRNLLLRLSKAGLVSCTKGKTGGASLKRTPDRILLSDIYIAVSGGEGIFSIRNDIPHRCRVTKNIHGVFADVSKSAEKAIVKDLSAMKLASIMKSLP
jgi:Rrf2 family transcriptional repressor of oqxAB